MLATPSGVSRAASSAFSCRCAVPGYQTGHSDYTRGQSPETGSLSRHLAVWEPLPSVSHRVLPAGFGFTSLVFLGDDAGLRTVASIGDFGWCSPGAHCPGLMRVGPAGEERRTPRYNGARLSSVPSGDRSANPASVPGRSGLQRAHISVSSARKRSGAEMLATPSGVSAAASSAFSCRCAVPGYQTSRSNYTGGQSRETGSLSRLFGSVETTAKCVSMGPAHCREATESRWVLLRLDSTGWIPLWWAPSRLW